MDEEAVIVTMKIYGRTYNVQYPSKARMVDLQTEFATKCKGPCKPGSNRRFFICIHCGQSDFSNKLRLNQHRFEQGCPRAKYDDGTPALMLPYPDFKPGQGKLVEVLGKGAAVVSEGASPQICGDAGLEGTVAGTASGFAIGDFGNEEPSPLRSESLYVTPTTVAVRGNYISPAPDTLFGAAPPRPLEESRPLRADRCRVRMTKEAKVASETREEEDGTKFKGKGSDSRPSAARNANVDIAISNPGSQSDGPAGTKIGMNSSPQQEIDATPVEGLMALKLSVVNRIFPKDASQVSGGSAKDGEGASREVQGSAKETLGAAGVAGEGGRALSRVILSDAVIVPQTEEASVCGGSEIRSSHHRNCASVEKDKDLLDCSVTGHTKHLKRGPASEASDLTASVPQAVGGHSESFDSADSGGLGFKSHAESLIGDAVNTDRRESSLVHASLKDAVAGMVLWEGNFDNNRDLLQCWAAGPASGTPFSYCPGLEGKFIARLEVLTSYEEAAEACARTEAAEMLKQLIPPTPPVKPIMPGLWHLRDFSEVKLPWVWETASGEDFLRSWEERVHTDEFEDRLARLLYWWTFKKTDSTLPTSVRDDISEALDALVVAKVQKVVYPGLHGLCTYIQYLVDEAKFQQDMLAHQDRLASGNEVYVEQVMSKFRQENARLREEILWDWCPLWQLLSRDDIGISDPLPPLPWRHNDLEAEEVRRRLTRSRMPHMAPPPLVYVLRVLFWNAYGLGRQLTCPMYGITRRAILQACAEEILVRRALFIFIEQGCFLFSGVEVQLGAPLHQQLIWEIGQVRDAKGEDIVSGVIDWVHRVQVRALQDLAAEEPLHFRSAWCTLNYQLWGEHSQRWAASLRIREDRDLGWVATTEAPQWSRRLQAVTASLQQKILQVAKVIAADDKDRWEESTGGEPAAKVTPLDLPAYLPPDLAAIPAQGTHRCCALDTAESATDLILEALANVTEFEEDDGRAAGSRVRKRQRLEKDVVPVAGSEAEGNAGTKVVGASALLAELHANVDAVAERACARGLPKSQRTAVNGTTYIAPHTRVDTAVYDFDPNGGDSCGAQ